MAQVIVEIDDRFIDWAAWAQDQLNKGGLRGSVQVVDETPTTSADAVVTVNTSPATTTPAASGQQDPWSGGAPQQDPWSAPTGSGTTTAPSDVLQDAPDQPLASGTIKVQGKNGIREVVFGKYGAPPCKHGQPACFTILPSGKKVWGCALGGSKRWKDKCDFQQWA